MRPSGGLPCGGIWPIPVANATSAPAIPRTPGAQTANRISSSVHSTGWRTEATTARSVRPTMSSRKRRLPPLVTFVGLTAIAM